MSLGGDQRHFREGIFVFWSALQSWNDSIADLGFWIAELHYDSDPILVPPIRNLLSGIRSPMTPSLHPVASKSRPGVTEEVTPRIFTKEIGHA